MTSQSAFHAALLDAATAVPAGLTDGNGHSAGRRYAVYRNNVAVSLRDALETGYPAIARLLGRENFRHVAGLHLRASPPETPCMMLYGADFPDFLASLAPLAHLPYLADVARIEWGLRCAYHAADSTPADATILQSLDTQRLMSARFTLAPSVQLLRSAWPAFDIWAYNMRPGAAKPTAVAQDTLILRAEFDPEPHLLADGGHAFVDCLRSGPNLGAALAAAGDGFDPGPTLGLLLANRAVTGIHLSKE